MNVPAEQEPKWVRYRRWLEAASGLSRPTIETYSSVARLFEETVGEFSEDGVVRFLGRYSGLSKLTYKSALTHFFKYLGRDDLVKYTGKARWAAKQLEWYWTEEEVKKIMDACRSLKHLIMVKLAYYLALRRKEIYDLRVSNIDFTRKVVRVRLAKKPANTYIEKPLYQDLAEDIKKYIEEEGKRPEDRLIDIHPVTMGRLVRAISARAGVRRASIHMLRHSRAAHLRMQGVQLDVLSKFLGHERLQTTMIYAHIGMPVMEKEIPPPFSRGGKDELQEGAAAGVQG